MHTVIRKIKLGTDFFAQDRPESVSDTSLRYFLSLEPVWSALDAPTGAREPRSSYFARVGFIMRAPTVVAPTKLKSHRDDSFKCHKNYREQDSNLHAPHKFPCDGASPVRHRGEISKPKALMGD